MRKSKVRDIIVALIILVIALFFIAGTYARYSSTGSGTGNVQVAKWAVKINDADITTTNTFTINFVEVANNNIVDGKIAPDGRLYADFEIDPTGSEVALDYEFALGQIKAGTEAAPDGIAVEKVCTVDGSTETPLTPTDGKYTGTIALASQTAALSASEKVTVRVYIKWTNSDEAARLTTDTAAGIAAPQLSIEVTGTAKQHIG